MRILMMSHGYPPTVSGVSIVVQKVARELVARGHDVAVLTASNIGEAYEDIDQGVRLVRVRSFRNPFWNDGPIPLVRSIKAEETVADFRPDLIHAHDGALLSQQLLRSGEKAGIPIIATCHFFPRFLTQYLDWGDKLEHLVESVAWDIAIKLLKPFDHIIFPTRTQQLVFLQQGLITPTTVISNGVNTKRYHPLRRSKRSFEQLPTPRIIFVGRLAKDKEIDVLLRAMPKIWAGVKAHLFIVGKGNDRERLEELSRRLGIEHCVHFLGFVPEKDLPELYRVCDVFAIASTCEVQSIPTLQAAVTGLPIVAVNAGALPELVRDGSNGFLVSPGNSAQVSDAILRILHNKHLAFQMGRVSYRIGHKHDEEQTFLAHEKVYESLIEQSRLPIGIPIEEVSFVEQHADYDLKRR